MPQKNPLTRKVYKQLYNTDRRDRTIRKYVWVIKVYEAPKNGCEFSAGEPIGWFEQKEDAVFVVKNNVGDIWETCFDYAVIEEIPVGLYPFARKRTWWKYKGEEEDACEQIEDPHKSTETA